MIELYHFGGAICAARVRLVLAEKGVAWESRLVPDLRDGAYLAVNPLGVVPTLIHDRVQLTESRIINEYLGEAFVDPPLSPRTPLERHRMRYWSKQIDDGLHLALYVLGFAAGGFGGKAFEDPAERAKRLPREPFKRKIASDLLADRWASPWVALALNRAETTVLELEERLSSQPWLAGDDYSLAEADFTPCVHRLEDMGLADLWASAPGVSAWWGRLQERQSFEAALTRWRASADATRFDAGREPLLAALGRARRA